MILYRLSITDIKTYNKFLRILKFALINHTLSIILANVKRDAASINYRMKPLINQAPKFWLDWMTNENLVRGRDTGVWLVD